MAVVNTLLDAAPPALRERLLVEFVGLLQRPTWWPERPDRADDARPDRGRRRQP